MKELDGNDQISMFRLSLVGIAGLFFIISYVIEVS